jgi:TM2 domain-containing membrane protein YozV
MEEIKNNNRNTMKMRDWAVVIFVFLSVGVSMLNGQIGRAIVHENLIYYQTGLLFAILAYILVVYNAMTNNKNSN